MKAKELKGVYNLNPTKMVMKSGSEQARDETSKVAKKINPKPTKTVGNDDGGVEKKELKGHTAFKTRFEHGEKNDGEMKSHEDHHAAVKMSKGK
jgi:hypothetical protein